MARPLTVSPWSRPAPGWCLPALLTVFAWATADTWRYLVWRLARWVVVALWRAEYGG